MSEMWCLFINIYYTVFIINCTSSKAILLSSIVAKIMSVSLCYLVLLYSKTRNFRFNCLFTLPCFRWCESVNNNNQGEESETGN